MKTFSKKRRASSPDDYETWVESDTANTLNEFDNMGSVRAVDIVIYENETDDISNCNRTIDGE